jgi:hypothetical protein
MMYERCRRRAGVPGGSMFELEWWLYRNLEALTMVLNGLEDSREGKLTDLGSFEKYADEDID